MPFFPLQPPAGLDVDGLRKHGEDQHREIARAWTSVDSSLTANATAIATNTANIATNTANIATLNATKIAVVRVQKFTASGTYTPNANMVYAIIECLGGGGGSGGVANSAVGSGFSSGSGGAGSYSRKLATAADIGASKPVTIGAAGTGGAVGNNNGNAGGDTSVGTLCIGKGGGGGGGGPNGAPGVGGVAGTGDLTGTGESGSTGSNQSIITVTSRAGRGGSSQWGSGGLETISAGTLAGGNSATGFGAGGGACATQNSAGATNGGNGSPGIVFITEYCTA